MARITTADEACEDVLADSWIQTLGMLAFVLHLILELIIFLPDCFAHGNEDSTLPHFILPFISAQVFHRTANAHRVVAGVIDILANAFLVHEALVPIVEFKATGRNDSRGRMIGFEQLEANPAEFVAMLLSSVFVRNVTIAEALKLS